MNKCAIEVHTRVGNDYRKWIHTARDLFAGSTILRRARNRACSGRGAPIEIFTIWTELMLTGFGIECLIKAIWLKQGHQLARDARYIGMTKNEGHDLVKLCRIAGMSLNRHETDALGRISTITRWFGRYPIARRVSETDMRWSSVGDRVIEHFIEKLQRQLRKDAA